MKKCRKAIYPKTIVALILSIVLVFASVPSLFAVEVELEAAPNYGVANALNDSTLSERSPTETVLSVEDAALNSSSDESSGLEYLNGNLTLNEIASTILSDELEGSIPTTQAASQPISPSILNALAIEQSTDEIRRLGGTTASVNFRLGPGANYGLIRVLPNGASVTILGENAARTWLQVREGNSTGWVNANFVEIGGRAGGVTTNSHIRQGIATTSSSIRVVPNGASVTVLGENAAGTRLQVRDGNTIGWVAAGSIEIAGRAGGVTTNSHIRQGIATTSSSIRVVPNGASVTVLGENAAGTRLQVRDGNTIGWVAASSIEIGGRAGFITTAANFRRGIAIDSELFRTLPNNTSIAILGENAARTRLQVREGNTIGWIGSGTATLLTLGTDYFIDRETPLRISPRLNSEASTIALRGARVRLVSGAVISHRSDSYVRVEILPSTSYPTAIRGYILSRQLTRTSHGFQVDQIPLARKTNIYNHSVRLLSNYSDTAWDNNRPHRSLGYHNLTRRNAANGDMERTFDCASFVAAVLDRAMGRSHANGSFLRPSTFDWEGNIRRNTWCPIAFFDNLYAPSSERKFQIVSRVTEDGRRIETDRLQVGDVILGRSSAHLMIYVGDGHIIHGANADRGIVRDNLILVNPTDGRNQNFWVQLGQRPGFRFGGIDGEIAILRYLGN